MLYLDDNPGILRRNSTPILAATRQVKEIPETLTPVQSFPSRASLNFLLFYILISF